METNNKIVYIEDNRAHIQLISRMLGIAGYEVLDAENGKKGLALIDMVKPAAVLVDYHLPDMSGYEIVRELRSRQDMAFTPIIMITANNLSDDRAAALETGIDAYLIKPVMQRELVRVVQSTLGERQAARS